MTNINNTTKELKKKLISTALASQELKEELKFVAQEITSKVSQAQNEATVVSIFENNLYHLLREINFPFYPEKEFFINTVRHKKNGRADSRVGAVIIEYKHPAKLKAASDLVEAKKQLSNYLKSLSVEADNEVFGFLIDGLNIYRVRVYGNEITEDYTHYSVNPQSLLDLIKTIVLLEQSALTSKNLIRDLCGCNFDGNIFHCARNLYKVLENKATPKTRMLQSEWEELFRFSHEDVSQQKRLEERREKISEIFNINITEAAMEYRALFSLHTAYAITLKMLAYRVTTDLKFGSNLVNYKSLVDSDSAVLRAFCEDLENGQVFRNLGLHNLLEGDFFSWYADGEQWNESLFLSVKNILVLFARYESIDKIFDSEVAVDLFRDLYEATVPQIVRASFGEIYTPSWLAEHVIKSAITCLDKDNANDWSLLDPCCGSGTFIIVAIAKIRNELKWEKASTVIKAILSRVAGIDLNPLAVLTSRIHFFIYISDLISMGEEEITIPVFLGDASYVPQNVQVSTVHCLEYELKTLKSPIKIILPRSLVKDTLGFIKAMYNYETLIREQAFDEAVDELIKNVPPGDRVPEVIQSIHSLTEQLIELEKNNWDGIWARVITNFIVTATIGPFDCIVGNPPWVDWKSIPSVHREKVKDICTEKGLFSGAGRTGGINLNLCALIAHVATMNWLEEDGVLAFLMPKELAYQSSYRGWREAVGGQKRSLSYFHDWSFVGHPFASVKEDFMTYIISSKTEADTIPAYVYFKNDNSAPASLWKNWGEAKESINIKEFMAGRIIPTDTAYTITHSSSNLLKLKSVPGEFSYIAREGIEFYPQELVLFEYIGPGPMANTVLVRNVQLSKSKYKINQQTIILEKEFLYPLVKGPSIKRFAHKYNGLLVPFPYRSENPHAPIEPKILKKEAPFLYKHYEMYKEILLSQTTFSDKIRGPNAGAYYGFARTGPYSFQNIYVGFRDNTKWNAVVISPTITPWEEKKRFLFQNHAVSICERAWEKNYINYDEAHYICAIMNSPIVEEFIYSTTDNRSFPIRPSVYLPPFEKDNKLHLLLSFLSKRLHRTEDNEIIERGLRRIEHLHVQLMKNR